MVLVEQKEAKKMTEMHQHPKKIKFEMEAATFWKVCTLILSVLFVVSILTSGFGFGGKKNTLPSDQVVRDNNPLQQQQPVVKAELKEDGDPSIGDVSAPIKIIEFSDYQCPFCERAFQQTYPEIQKLVKEGKVRLTFKDYPLPFHEQADEAAVAANCANEQNKYWEMHDKLFQTQQSWSGNSDPYTIFKGYAKELKLDEKKFAACVADPKQAKEVQDDLAEGSAAGVSGTPTFYINGVQLVGAQPWSAFKQVIDTELSK